MDSWSTQLPGQSWDAASGPPLPGPSGPLVPPGPLGPPPPPQRSGGLSGLQIGAIIATVIVLIGILGGVFVARAVDTVVETFPPELLSGDLEPGHAYGDNPRLDALWDGCAAGVYDDCDTLYFISEIGSEYEYFGDSCGRRNEPAGLCTSIYGP